MNKIKLSATSARNNFFELLNEVALGKQFIIEKDNEEIAVLSPKKTKTDWEELKKVSKETHGILRHDEPFNTDLRKKDTWKRIGKWDKGLKLTK